MDWFNLVLQILQARLLQPNVPAQRLMVSSLPWCPVFPLGHLYQQRMRPRLSGGAAGEIAYQTASGATSFTGAGTTGQVLLSGGTGSPTWTSYIAVGASGNITTTAPSSGTGLVVNAVSGANAIQFQDEGGTTQDAGYRGIPQNSQSGTTYTAVLADRGKHIYATNASAKTITIPANGSVAYPIGTTLTFVNIGAGTMTIAITTDTLYQGGTGTTGSRSLQQYGIATAVKLTSTTWVISGTGLT